MTLSNRDLVYFFAGALHEPGDAISYYVTQRLQEFFPDKIVYHTDDGEFELEKFLRAKQCTGHMRANPMPQRNSVWSGVDSPTRLIVENAWFEIDWQGSHYEVVMLYVTRENSYHAWIVADSEELAGALFRRVCAWETEVHGEIVVYENGAWVKSEQLFQSIRSTTFDNLVLPAEMKQALQNDFSSFFSSQGLYDQYGVPWKRGVLLVGPPGNGKTHTIKALVNWLEKPCLYVKSFRSSRFRTTQESIRAVFARARRTTPCILVLEDLDSLVDNDNRSFLLNELDGFANNRGILVVATTNHPEKLDPALTERPSRFDRKYEFTVPALPERVTYLTRWNEVVEAGMRITAEEIEVVAQATEGFSFAYLKELILSSMIEWIATHTPGGMNAQLLEQAGLLRTQMNKGLPAAADSNEESRDVEDDYEDHVLP